MTNPTLGTLSWKSLGMALAASASLLLPGLGHAASSCAELHAQDPSAQDGNYTLTLGSRAVEVYCHDMAGTPSEYLNLPNTGSTTNYSHYGQGPNTSAGGQKTWFTRVRFNPGDLTLTVTDTTFSTSQGWKRFGSNYAYASALGDAGDCVDAWSQTGRANVDLRGTPFGIAPDQFQVFGYMAAGSATYSSASQVVDLQGGGYCGGIIPPTANLQLFWQPASCAELHAQNPSAPDGNYTLTLGSRTVEVYCHDMAGTPREYLNLPNTGSTTNYSHYGQGPNTSAGGQKTWFTRVRFNPGDLTLTVTDTTFSTSQGWKRFGSNYAYASALGDAGDCVGAWSQTGRANMDLRGTPFGIAPDQFQVFGYKAAGSATYSSASQVVNLQGGGYCGGIIPPTANLQLFWLQ
ncbi:GON domain-containing protein [Hyalangium gracile]|uniref:GON domain-containing protein n=1 Tax=Hyalangium gracile TaxID=394092 RepID=UPI001CCAA851|nr:GON domain-containing protein [Hyalangium gracile]